MIGWSGMSMALRHASMVGAVLAAVVATRAPAAALMWDADATPPASGGTGTWNAGTAANWYNGATDVVWPTSGADNDAVFADAAGTVTISGGVTANGIAFSTTGYSIQGSTLTLNGPAPTLTASTGVSATIGSLLAGTAGVALNTTTGTTLGRLTLNGNNAGLSGGVTLGNGSGNTSGTATPSANSGGYVVLGHNNALGAGTVTSAGAQLQAGVAGLTVPNAFTVSTGALRFGGANDLALSGVLTLVGAVRGIGNYSGNKTLTVGDIVLADGFNVSFEAVDAAAANGTTRVNGIISGSGGVTVQGSYDNGTVILAGANTYSGGTALYTGTLRAANSDSALGNGAVTVAGSATLATASGGGARTLENAITVNSGQTLSLDSGNASLTLNGAIGNAGTVQLASGGTTTLNGALSGAGTLQMATGSGTLVYGGISSGFTGGITLATATGGTFSVPGVLTTSGALSNPYSKTISIGGNLSVGAITIAVNNTTTINGAGTFSATSLGVSNYSTVSCGMTGTFTDTGTFYLGNADSQYGYFSQSAGTVNLTTTTAGAIRIGHWPNEIAKYNLSGGVWNATGADTVLGWDGNGEINVSGGTANLRGVQFNRAARTNTGLIALTAGLLRIGAGSLVDSSTGANTITINLGAGTVGALTAWSSALPMSLTSASPGVTFDTSGGNITLSGALGSTGALKKTGAGTLTLSGANTYSGATTLSVGTLTLNYATQNNSKLSDTAALTLAGGKLELAGGSHTETVGSCTLNAGAATITRSSGTSVLQLKAITRNAGATLNADAASVANTTSANDATGVLGYWATVAGTDLATVSGGALVAYAGYTDIAARGPGSTVPDDATRNVRINSAGTSGNIALAAATTTINALLQNTATAATVDTAGQALRAYSLMVGAGQEALTLGAAAGDGTLTSAGAGGDLLLNTFSANPLTVNAVIANNTSASTLTKAGTGTAVLAAANTYGGTTTVGAGTLQIGGGGTTGAVGSGTLNVLGGATLALSRSDGVTITSADLNLTDGTVSALAGANAISTTAGNNMDILGSSAFTAAAGATLDITGTGNIGFSSAPTLTFGGAGGGTLSRSIASGGADGTVVKSGAGAWTLSNTANNWSTGGLVIGAGTLRLGSSNVIPDGNGKGNVTVTGTLDLNAFSETINGLAGAGTVDTLADGTPTLTVGGANATSSFTGVIKNTAGTLALVKTGLGNVTLGGASAYTYAGNTTIDAGTLTITGAAVAGGVSKLSTPWVYVNPGATLYLGAGSQFSWGPGTPAVSLDNATLGMSDGQYNYVKTVVMANGATWALGTGSLINGLTGANFALATVTSLASATTSTITSRGGAIALNASGTTGSVVFDVARGTAATDLLVSAVLADYNGVLGYVLKTGDGILTLSGANVYTRGTTLRAGTLVWGNAGALGAAGTVTLNDTGTDASDVALLTSLDAGATLARNITVANLGTGTVTIGSSGGSVSGGAIYSGTLTLNRATTLQGVNTDKTLFSGQIAGSVGTLTISGGARVTVKNTANSFSGNVAITGAGTILQVSEASAGEVLPDASSVDVGAGATLQLAGSASATETVDALTGSGSVTRNVAGTQTLSLGSAGGNGAFSGGIQNGSGVIALAKGGGGAQSLNGASTYTGGTTVNGGTLLAGNASGSATGSGPVTVKSGAQLGGSGYISGNVSAEGGSTLTPGGAGVIGTLHLQGDLAVAQDARMNWDFTPAANDGVAVNGTLSLPSRINLNINTLQSGSLQDATLFTYAFGYSGPDAIDLTGTGTSGLFLALHDSANKRIVLHGVVQGTTFIVR